MIEREKEKWRKMKKALRKKGKVDHESENTKEGVGSKQSDRRNKKKKEAEEKRQSQERGRLKKVKKREKMKQ